MFIDWNKLVAIFEIITIFWDKINQWIYMYLSCKSKLAYSTVNFEFCLIACKIICNS